MTDIYADINGFLTYQITVLHGVGGHGFTIMATARNGYTYLVAEAHEFATAEEAAQEAKQRLSGVVAPILLWPEHSASRRTPPRRDPAMNRYAVVHTVTQIVDADNPERAEDMARQALEDSTPLRFPTITDAGEIHPLPDDE